MTNSVSDSDAVRKPASHLATQHNLNSIIRLNTEFCLFTSLSLNSIQSDNTVKVVLGGQTQGWFSNSIAVGC